MTFAALAAFLAATLLILSRAKALVAPARAPGVVIMSGAAASLIFRATGATAISSEWIAAGADALLAALAFAAAAQFRVSELARVCPASFRLTLGGAPLFLIICGVAAFGFAPNLSLSAAFLIAGALTLNGAAFDRRAVAYAPAPAVIKAAVRLESAAILALGLPVAVLLEAAATAAPTGMPLATPMFETAKSLFFAFAFGGCFGLSFAYYDNKLKNNTKRAAPAIMAAAAAALTAGLLGYHPAVAAAAAGLLWGEQTTAPMTTRVRMRGAIERTIGPVAYFAFGAILAPRIFQADLLSIIFAVFAVTLMRAGPRLISLRKTNLPAESQRFLAWFGGAPGAASALFLISLFDAPSVIAQDTVLTIGAVAVLAGVLAARMTSRPLLRALLKETALAKKRALFAR